LRDLVIPVRSMATIKSRRSFRATSSCATARSHSG
jgi:hypothetical protein